MHFKTVFLSSRPAFLLLPIVCCLLAFSLVSRSALAVDYWLMLPVFLAALFAHISVNVLNEYLDFSSGLDLKTRKTPFSGGSGALPDNPAAAADVLKAAIIAILITVALGLYLLVAQGYQLLLPGLCGLFIIIAYTNWINRIPWLCLIAPGTGFGLIMVAGSYFALSGDMNLKVVLVSLVPFFLVNNLLLLNQYPDIEADQSVGRKHFPIRYGVRISSWIYLFFLLSSFALIALLVLDQQLPVLAWITLFALVPGLFAYSGAFRYGHDLGRQPQYLAANVLVTLVTPLLLASAIYLG